MNPITDQKNVPQHPLCSPATRDELLAYLRESGSALSPAAALASAVKLWIARDRAAAGPERGYQWKQLFLPESTRLRMRYADGVLVEHANHQSQNTLERRLPRYRRGHDLLDDIH